MPEQNSKPLVVYVVAGEASGDALGAGAMKALFELTQGNVVFHGIGGEKMLAAGLQESLFPYQELSLMGFAEILPHLLRLTARINFVADDIALKQPDILLTIDSPGFCYRVAKKLKKTGSCPRTKRVHYVAPTVWAYKPGRAKKFAAVFDHLLVLLPFEPPYFTSEGLNCTFVGHPVACPLSESESQPQRFRTHRNIPAHAPLIALLPGSRPGELRRHLAAFAESILLLARQMKLPPGIVVPVPSFLADEVTLMLANFPLPIFIVQDEQEKRDAIAACDLALVKSGTVALEVAMAGVPMAVAYRTGRISAFILRRLIRIRHANLLNILLQREAIPELLQELCTPLFLAESMGALQRFLPFREAQLRQAQEALAQLRPQTGTHPHVAAASTLLSLRP